jgi:hypothetical protein
VRLPAPAIFTGPAGGALAGVAFGVVPSGPTHRLSAALSNSPRAHMAADEGRTGVLLTADTLATGRNADRPFPARARN